MEHTEVINNLTVKAIDNMNLPSNMSQMGRDDYNEFVLDTVINTYLEVAHAVYHDKRMEK